MLEVITLVFLCLVAGAGIGYDWGKQAERERQYGISKSKLYRKVNAPFEEEKALQETALKAAMQRYARRHDALFEKNKILTEEDKIRIRKMVNAALQEEREIENKSKNRKGISLDAFKAAYRYGVEAGQIPPENQLPEENLDEELQKILDETYAENLHK